MSLNGASGPVPTTRMTSPAREMGRSPVVIAERARDALEELGIDLGRQLARRPEFHATGGGERSQEIRVVDVHELSKLIGERAPALAGQRLGARDDRPIRDPQRTQGVPQGLGEARDTELLSRRRAAALADEPHQRLLAPPRSGGHHERAAGEELLQQGRRRSAERGEHQDPVVGCVRRPARVAVATTQRHVGDSARREPCPSRGGEALHPLERVDMLGELREHRRRVTRACPHQEHVGVRGQPQRGDHLREGGGRWMASTCVRRRGGATTDEGAALDGSHRARNGGSRHGSHQLGPQGLRRRVAVSTNVMTGTPQP